MDLPDALQPYFEALPPDRQGPMRLLWSTLQDNLPPGFAPAMQYNMPGFVVPLASYPPGYHVTPGMPLPFISIASQKNHVAVYHMGIYSDPDLLTWFVEAYPHHVPTKLDMGKSCIRFKNMSTIPYDLLGQLATRMTVEEWIRRYEAQRADT